jgi:hypothetical protein
MAGDNKTCSKLKRQRFEKGSAFFINIEKRAVGLIDKVL